MSPKPLLPLFMLCFAVGSSCKKSAITQTATPPPNSLIGKKWLLDTITINPPETLATLSLAEKFTYHVALNWAKRAEVTFKEDGTVVTGGGGDVGYRRWKLINNNIDIEVTLATGNGNDTLRAWSADNTNLTYISALRGRFDCTFIYK